MPMLGVPSQLSRTFNSWLQRDTANNFKPLIRGRYTVYIDMHHELINCSYNTFLKDLADINLAQQVADAAFKREFNILDEFGKNQSPESIIGNYAFGFDNPFTGQLEKYAFRKTSVIDLKNLTLRQKNNQYCWLLSNAFEKFECYVKNVFEIITGQDAPRELNKILAYFSNNYPELNRNEKTNKIEIHLKVAVLLVEKLRHAIVHDQGQIKDSDVFTSKVIKQSGVNNNRVEHSEFIQQFILDGKVHIVEQPIIDGFSLPRYHDVFRYLVSYLIAYAYLTKEHT